MSTKILPPRGTVILVLSVMILALAAVYGPALGHGFVNLDDDMLLERNPTVRGLNPENIRAAFTTFDPELYVPFTMLSYQAEYSLAGELSAPLIHFGNLVLHAVSSLLVAWFLFLLFDDALLAAFGGLLFAVHPLNAEAVMWASARKDVLSSAFLFGSLVAYVLNTRGHVSRAKRILPVILFAAALLSKVSVLMFPFALLAVDWWRNGSLKKSDWIAKTPYFALSFAFGCIALFAKSQPFAETPILSKLLLIPVSTAFYLGKFLVPTHLTVLYPFTGSPALASFTVLGSTLLLAALLLGASAMRKRSIVPLISLCTFFLLLAPTFLNSGRGGELYFASDRYMYVPMVALLVIIIHFASHVLTKYPHITMPAAAFLLVLFGWMSAGQAATWENPETLYTNVLLSYPDAFAARNNLGMWYMNSGKLDLAKREFTSALAIHASEKAAVNLAAAHELAGDPKEALRLLAPLLAMPKPSSDAYLTAGNAYKHLGKNSEAITAYRAAIAADPDSAFAYNNLGALYLSMQDWQSAADILETAIARRADTEDVYFNYGIAEEQLGNDDQAIAAYAKATSLRPNDTEAFANLATLLVKTKKIDQAKLVLDHLLRTDPDNVRGKTLQKLLY